MTIGGEAMRIRTETIDIKFHAKAKEILQKGIVPLELFRIRLQI